MSEEAQISVSGTGGNVVVALAGRLDVAETGRIWQRVIQAAREARGREMVFDLSQLDGCDMSGATLMAAAERTHEAPVRLSGANEQVAGLVELARQASAARQPAAVSGGADLGGMVRAQLEAAEDGFAFLGETAAATVSLPARRRMLRVSDLLRFADQAGFQAIPLVLLLGFLMGLILAYQSAVPMRQFGAELYVANLVSVSLTRELGPLLAAVILAGRTGSAFAAEIGTMKVNEEIDALVTMGLDPVTMQVLPRMAAALLVMPALTLALDIAGLVGMAVVMKGFGYPLSIVEHQVQYWTSASDLVQGLVKGSVFGAAIAAIGCRAGLSTGVGPRAVGVSATKAVVGGIVATIVLDGIFAVFLNRLGW